MIDFRYHLVSIVAVFLALALGLLLGSTVLRPYALKGLQALSKHQKQQIDSLQQTNKQLQSQLASNNQFAQANAPQILHQLLAGQRVVLVVAPGAPSSVVSGDTQNLGLAGDRRTGQAQVLGDPADHRGGRTRREHQHDPLACQQLVENLGSVGLRELVVRSELALQLFVGLLQRVDLLLLVFRQRFQALEGVRPQDGRPEQQAKGQRQEDRDDGD